MGDGALRYADVFAEVSHVELGSAGLAYPSAAALVELAHPRAIREEFVQPWELEPPGRCRPPDRWAIGMVRRSLKHSLDSVPGGYERRVACS